MSKNNLQGYDEVISLVNQSEAKFNAAMEAEKTKGNKKIAVNKKNGRITIKKALKKAPTKLK